MIKDLEITLKIIPKMTKYNAFGEPDKDGEYCVVDGTFPPTSQPKLLQLG